MHGRSYSCLLIAVFLHSALTLALCQEKQSDHNKQVAPVDAKAPSQPLGLRPVPSPVEVLPRTPIRHSWVVGFREMEHAAGIIFSGTVLDIQPHFADGMHSLETVAITFRVENAIRGATRGQNLTISQWAGLWSTGQRYRLGERVVLFLYPASKLGLTSSVAGPMGRLEMNAAGRVLLSELHRSAFRRDPILGSKPMVQFGEIASAVRRAEKETAAGKGDHEN